MDPHEFGQAYETCFPKTVRLLTSKGVSYQVATEIAQAAWVRGFEKRDQLFSPACVGLWVNTIALNLLKDEFRRPETCWPLALEIPFSTTPWNRAIATQLFAACDKSEKQLLKRRYVDGYSIGEIAGLMKLEVASVRVRLHRLRRKLGKRNGFSPASAVPRPEQVQRAL